jgi:enterochelin esterase-like enzyme
MKARESRVRPSRPATIAAPATPTLPRAAPPAETIMTVTRRSSLIALLGAVTAGCGGGGSDTAAPPMAGSVQTQTISSRSNSTSYPLNIYLPPGSAASRATAATVYLLDGDSRWQAVIDIVEAMHAQVIVVGIGNEQLRGRDYVPVNTCTPGGGGQGLFLDFIRLDLAPFMDTTFGGDPQRRILLGHSHGGSFVIYALFNEAPASRLFFAYLASDSSIDCMTGTVLAWESAYAAANTALPVRLHVSYSANVGGNVALVQQIQSRHYSGLTMAAQIYGGGHIGMIPAAFNDALTFALA